MEAHNQCNCFLNGNKNATKVYDKGQIGGFPQFWQSSTRKWKYHRILYRDRHKYSAEKQEQGKICTETHYIYSSLCSCLTSILFCQSVQSLSRVRLFATPWITARQASLSHHQLPEFTQTHVHLVGDAIQPSHPLLSPFPPAPQTSQHQGLFQWVNSSHEVAKVLEYQL